MQYDAMPAYDATSTTYNVTSNYLKLMAMKTRRLKVTNKPVEKVNIAYLIKVKLNIQATTKVQVFSLRQRQLLLYNGNF